MNLHPYIFTRYIIEVLSKDSSNSNHIIIIVKSAHGLCGLESTPYEKTRKVQRTEIGLEQWQGQWQGQW